MNNYDYYESICETIIQNCQELLEMPKEITLYHLVGQINGAVSHIEENIGILNGFHRELKKETIGLYIYPQEIIEWIESKKISEKEFEALIKEVDNERTKW